MHNSFQNKRRRLVNFREMQVEGVLPEHFAQYYPQFISLLERYYEFQDTNNSTELISHLFASRDINETDLTLLTFIEDELLLGEAYFQGFGSTDVELRAAANFSNILFRSKGSKFAIEWFFRSFYGEDVEVIYPKENIFKVGDESSQIGPNSLRYITDDKLYQTFALLIRVGIPISKWKEVFKLFSHPAGMYLGGEVFLVNDVEVGVKTLNDAILQYTTPSYDMTPATQTVAEGTVINLNVTGSNVRNGGTDALFYYFNADSDGSTDFIEDSDFTSAHNPKPDSATPKYLEINSSTGVIQIATVIDEITEATETLNVILTDADSRILDSATISITDVLSTYNVALDSVRTSPDIIFEGDTATFKVTGSNTAFGGNVDLNWYVDLATDSNFGEAGRGKINAADLSAGFPTSASPAIVQIRNDSGSFTVPTVINTSLIDLIDLDLPTNPANVSIIDPINVYNKTMTTRDIPASTVLSVPFRTLNTTDSAEGAISWEVDATRQTDAGFNLVMWISENAGGSTGTNASSVVSIADEQAAGSLSWAHGASAGSVQGLDPDTTYYQNIGWIANTADYSNWTSGDLNTSTFGFNSEVMQNISFLSNSIEPDDIGIGALERLVVKVKSITTGQPKGTGVAYLEGIAPEFTVSVPGANQVVEGEDFTFDIQVLADQVGDTFTWQILDSDLSSLTDTRVLASSGIFTAASAGVETVTVSTVFDPVINDTTVGTLISAGNVQRTFHDCRILVTNNNTSQTAQDTIEIFDGPELFSINPTAVPGIQGDSAAFLMLGSNATDSDRYFYVGLAETTLADYDSDVPLDASRQVIHFDTVDTNGFRIGKVDEVNTPLIGSPTYGDRARLIFASDGDTSNERVELYLYDAASGGNKLTEVNYTVGPAPVGFAGATTIDETDNASQSYTITGLADGTYGYYFEGTEIDGGLTFGGGGTVGAYDINADDFETGYFASSAQGTLTIASGTGTIAFEMKADKIREGVEKFKIFITDGLGFQVGSSPVITVNDTSVPAYTIANYAQLNSTAGGAITTVDEDDALNLNIVADSRMTETLYVQLEDVTAGATSIYPITQKTIDAVDGDNWLQFATDGDNNVVDGNRTFKVLIGVESFPVAEIDAVATLTLTLEDPTAVQYVLTASDTTPNESDLVTFTITGNNIPDGTYYYKLTDLATPETTAAGSSTTIVSVSGGSAVSVGDEAVTLSGVVQNASASSILLSQANSYSIGQTLFFMPADLYDYFSTKSQTIGSVSISNNTGSFQMQLAESGSLDNRAFSIVLGTGPSVPTVLASETITVQNVTTSVDVNFQLSDLFFDDFETRTLPSIPSVTAIAGFRVKSDGYIYRTGTGAGESPTQAEYIADGGSARWTSGSPSANQFEVKYELIAQSGGQAQGLFLFGDFGVWNDIDAQGKSVSASITSGSSVAYQVSFSCQIREKANPLNTETIILANANNGGTGGGLLVSILDATGGGNPLE